MLKIIIDLKEKSGLKKNGSTLTIQRHAVPEYF